MQKRKLFIGAAIIGLSTAGRQAEAGSCSYVATELGDSQIAPQWGCGQTYIHDMWTRFSMWDTDWDGGFGFDDPCNDSKPLKRTFNALQAMAYGVTATPTCSTSDDNVAKWAYCWAGNQIDELDSGCGDGSAYAYTTFGGVDDYTDVYMRFFYELTVIERAATLFHEARHAHGWCQHTKTGCALGNNCEAGWTDGCHGFGSGSGPGAWNYHVRFLAWYLFTARAGWINEALRSSAVAKANMILIGRFEQNPCFILNSNGTTYSTCH